jgi:hypothetical protein
LVIFSSLMPRAYGRLFILQVGNSAGFLHSFVTERTGHIGNNFRPRTAHLPSFREKPAGCHTNQGQHVQWPAPALVKEF